MTSLNKNIKTRHQNDADDDDEDSEETKQIVLTQNNKINNIIESLKVKFTRKESTLLFVEIAERPEICVDFNFSLAYYLNKYWSSPEEICLSETGVFILSAAKIYGRRVDFIFDSIQRTLSGIDKNVKEIEKFKAEKNKENLTAKEKEQKSLRRPPKRSLPKDDSLHEYEMEPKQFKKAYSEKISDKKDACENTFEPPKNYFKNLQKYLEFRNNNKKIQKESTKYDENADPSLYKYSTIEDFDYEDDIDSKRNYKSLHGHIEHRYSTIVSDINFLLHFKIKDFVEEELEENEKNLSLGITQTTQKRKWYSLCDKSYIDGLLELENEILEKETNTKILRKRRRFSQSNNNFDSKQELLNQNKNNICNENNSQILDNEKIDSGDIELSSGCKNLENKFPEEELANNIDKICNEEITNNCRKDICHLESTSNTENAFCNSQERIELNEKESMIDSTLQINISQPSNDLNNSINELNLENNLVASDPQDKEAETNPDNNDQSKTGSVSLPNENMVDILPNSTLSQTNCDSGILETDMSNCLIKENVNTEENSTVETVNEGGAVEKHESEFPRIILDAEENIDPSKIIVRLGSEDEGIFLSDLDDIQTAMLSPKVVAIDIRKSIDTTRDDFTLNLDKTMDNFFGGEDIIEFNLDEFEIEDCCPLNIFEISSDLLTMTEDFFLPHYFYIKKPSIELNILKIPDKCLKLTKRFSLPEEYDLYKANRCRKKIPVEKTPKMLKILNTPMTVFNETDNDKNVNSSKSGPTNESISLGLPSDDEDFVGFSLNDEEKDKNDSEMARKFSTDSGIDLLKRVSLDLLNSTPNFIEDNILSSTMICNDVGIDADTKLSKIISTVSQEKSSLLSETQDVPNETTTLEQVDAENQTKEVIQIDATEKSNSAETTIYEIDRTENSACSAKVIDVFVLPPIQNIENVKENDIECNKDTSIPNENSDNNHNIEEQQEKSIFDGKVIDNINNSVHDEGFVSVNNTNANNFSDDDFLENNDVFDSKITEKMLWHKHLKPILAKSKSRHHFDIYDLGTEIMEKFSVQNNNQINFQKVMENKDASYTTRYFLSMLLLANTNNIKLNVKNQSFEKPSEPEDIEIVLLSTKRHTVSVEDNIGIVNNKNRLNKIEEVVTAEPTTTSSVKIFAKPTKIAKKSIGNEDNDSGFFSSSTLTTM